MEVIYLSQDDRFSVRLTTDACARLPEGSFNPATAAPVYAMRIDDSGAATNTYFLLPAADGAFHQVAMEECRLAQR